MTGGLLTGLGAIAAAWAGCVLYGIGFRAGHKAGHDRVVQWMLLNAAMPDEWDPTKEWVDA